MRLLTPCLFRFALCLLGFLRLGNWSTCLGGESQVWLDWVPASSTLNSSATLEGQTDSHAQSLTGRSRIAFKGGWPPTSAKLLEFQFQTTNGQVYSFHYGILGSLTVNIAGLGSQSSLTPATPTWEPLTQGQVTFHFITNQLTGVIDYRGSGLVCSGLIAKGLPCVGTQSLSSNLPTTIDAIAGKLFFTHDSVHWSGQVGFSGPALANAPEMGTIQGMVTFVAKGVATPIVAGSMSSGSLTLSWPALTTPWKPEILSTLVPGATWTTTGIVPARTNGDLSVSIPLKSGSAFFRLVTGP